MSLTSVLASDRALAARLSALVPAGSSVEVSALPLRAPPLTTHYPLIGTAFDYLFRFEVQRRNRDAVAKEWVAEHAVTLARAGSKVDGPTVLRWPPGADRVHLTKLFDANLASAKVAHTKYIALSNPLDRDIRDIAEHAIRLAKLDPIYRAGYVDLDSATVDAKDIQDLVALIGLVPFDQSMSMCERRKVLLNPTFGRFSTGIGGADADFVAGETLVDIKTTKNPQLKPHLAQIVGYAMLADAFRSREMSSFPEVRSIGIYYSRQGHLELVPFEPIRGAPDYSGAYNDLLSRCTRESLSLVDVLTGDTSPTRRETAPEGTQTKAKRRPKTPSSRSAR